MAWREICGQCPQMQDGRSCGDWKFKAKKHDRIARVDCFARSALAMTPRKVPLTLIEHRQGFCRVKRAILAKPPGVFENRLSRFGI